MILITFIFQINLIFASNACTLYPTESYSQNANLHSYLKYNSKTNFTELSAALRHKRNADYEKLFSEVSSLAVSTQHPQAYYNLGQFYRKGLGTEANTSFAIENYYHAAMRGSTKAITNLAYLMDQSIFEEFETLPTLIIPLDKEYSLYWLLSAISLNPNPSTKNSLKDLLDYRIHNDPYYKEIFYTNYPYYNIESLFTIALDELVSFKRNFNSIFKRRADVDYIIPALNKAICNFKIANHFIKFNRINLLNQIANRLNESAQEIKRQLQYSRYEIKNHRRYYKLLNFLRDWSLKEATYFLDIKLPKT